MIPTRTLTHVSRKVGLDVPVLGLGCAPLGNLFGNMSEADCHDTVQAAYKAGMWFDTAPFYGFTLSEHRLGAGLRWEDRDSYVLCTKVGRDMVPTSEPFDKSVFRGSVLPFRVSMGYTYDAFMRQHQASLQRLGVERVDVLVIHDLDLDCHGTKDVLDVHLKQLETSGYKALEELRDNGDVACIGAGLNHAKVEGYDNIARTIADAADIDFFLVAGNYTPLRHTDCLDHVLPLCADRGIGVVIGGPFNSGILARDVVDEQSTFYYAAPDQDVIDRVKTIQDIVVGKHGLPVAAVALQFPLQHPAVKAVIPGAVAPEQVMQNKKLMTMDIPSEVWTDLKAAGILDERCPTE